jgi:DNA helicase IV
VLLYRNRGELTEGDVLVVGPSTVFMRYIERVLPELGRTTVRQQSIDRIALHDVEVRGEDDPDARRVTGLAEMTTIILNHLSPDRTRPDARRGAGRRPSLQHPS